MRNTQHQSYSLLIQFQILGLTPHLLIQFRALRFLVVAHLCRCVIYQPSHRLGWRIRSPRCSLYFSLLSVGGYDLALRGKCGPSRFQFAAVVGERREDETR